MLNRTRHLIVIAFVLGASPARAQDVDPTGAVRALYASAAYDDALSAIAKAPTSARLEAYRAFCLLALGNVPEAQAAVKRAVAADPLLVPTEAEASPRVRAFFEGVRTELLPSVVRETYARAKAAYVANDRLAAHADFVRTLELIASLDATARQPLADLELVAREFRDLSNDAAPPAAPSAKGAPAPSQPQAPLPAVVTKGAVPIQQTFPIWRWSSGPAEPRRGVVRLHLDAQGAVLGAEMVVPTDPRYDQEVLAAARQWRYQPATRDGRPLPSELDVTFLLKGK